MQQSDLDLSDHVHAVGSHYVALGDHSDVWKGEWNDGSGRPKQVAIKVLRGGSSGNHAWIDSLKRRLTKRGTTWHRFDHTNVSKFFGLSFKHTYMPALVLPYFPNGNILQYCDANGKDDDQKLQLIRGIAQGIQYLHDFSPSVVHGDIRSANILIDDVGQAVLCDIGLASIVVGTEFTSIKTAGSCRWSAPEIMNPPDLECRVEEPEDWKDEDDPIVFFSKESDVYAFAMTVIEIFTGKIPFSDTRNDSAVIFDVLDGKRPELPQYLKTLERLGILVEQCWDQHPDKRPTARAVCDALGAKASSPTEESYAASVIRLLGYLRSWLPV